MTPAGEARAFDEDAREAARVLFARACRFVLGAASVDQLPADDVPEVAFAGRSNVGKSSLINALVNRHDLARASGEPGRTREVNLFDLDDGRLRLVDLPGYGFARTDRRTAARFQNLARDYLRGRPNLKRVYLLVDSRHGLKPADAEAMDALDGAAFSYQVVLTKADKLRPASEGPRLAQATLQALSRRAAAFPRVLLTSAASGEGLGDLRAEAAFACGLAG